MNITNLIIIIMLLVLIILITYLIILVRKLKQPIIQIDEKSAKLIAKELSDLKIPETNEYDAIKAVVNSQYIKDYQMEDIISSIRNRS